jgi:hypothetical protein
VKRVKRRYRNVPRLDEPDFRWWVDNAALGDRVVRGGAGSWREQPFPATDRSWRKGIFPTGIERASFLSKADRIREGSTLIEELALSLGEPSAQRRQLTAAPSDSGGYGFVR